MGGKSPGKTIVERIAMGPGHLGVAFAVKPLAPKAPLWLLLVASEALDLLSGGFSAFGMESLTLNKMDFVNGIHVTAIVPYSHGLFMSLTWSLLAGGIGYLALRDRKAASLIGLMVFSHWILDFIVHGPDLPIFFDVSQVLGLGLWTTGIGLILSLTLEIILLIGGIVIYVTWRKRVLHDRRDS
jgi:hypothetical protein